MNKNPEKAREAKRKKAEEFAKEIYPHIAKGLEAGGSYRLIAKAFNMRGLKTQRGGKWTGVQVKRIVDRME